MPLRRCGGQDPLLLLGFASLSQIMCAEVCADLSCLKERTTWSENWSAGADPGDGFGSSGLAASTWDNTDSKTIGLAGMTANGIGLGESQSRNLQATSLRVWLPISQSAHSYLVSAALDEVIAQLSSVLLGKEAEIRLAITGVLAGGHMLLEDLPGMGKTTLAEALARVLGLEFHRLHFTNDLWPADLTGVNVLDQRSGQFRFQPGPLFCQVLLADELNRASPRSQSALLEAMASSRVSVDGTSHELPRPFVVIASQNGLDQTGTAPLPESQLDRFLMRLSLGYPSRDAEAAMLEGKQAPLNKLEQQLTSKQLIEIQSAVSALPTSPALVDYVLDLLTVSREIGTGLSPRAGIALMAAAKAWAFLHNSSRLLPDHVQAVFPAVAEHRLDSGHRRQSLLSHQIMERVDALR